MSPRVVLVGPPGAGKTTVGRLVAEALGEQFRDTDADVEAATGSTIADLFVVEGEARFRELERAAVAAALADHAGVLALGGGAVLDAEAPARLAGHLVVHLDVDLTDAVHRVGLARDRPLLLGNPRGQLKQLMDSRRPRYVELARATVDTTGRTAEDVADEVVVIIHDVEGAA